MQLGTSFVYVLVNSNLLHYGGDLAIGAFGIINSVNTLIIMIIIGLNQGTQPIIGYNFGAKNYGRMFKTLKYGVIIGTCITTFGFLVGTLLQHFMVSLFTQNIGMQSIASKALHISVTIFPIIGFQIVVTNFFQSIGKAKISIFLSLTRQVLFLIPCLLLLPTFYNLNGVWMSIPVSDGLSTAVTAATIYFFVKKV